MTTSDPDDTGTDLDDTGTDLDDTHPAHGPETTDVSLAYALARENAVGFTSPRLSVHVASDVPTPYGPVLLAVDQDLVPHLMVPAGPEAVRTRRRTTLRITERDLPACGDGAEGRHADLHCVDPELRQVFIAIAEYVVAQIRQRPDQPGQDTLRRALDHLSG